jgi:hypothetical protein
MCETGLLDALEHRIVIDKTAGVAVAMIAAIPVVGHTLRVDPAKPGDDLRYE